MRFFQNWIAREMIADNEEKWFSATVPGNIQYDYAVANGKEDFFFGTKATQFDEIEDSEWEYKTKLSYESSNNERIFFVAEGIDYLFGIYLDGIKIYDGEGMFSKTEIDITDSVKLGSELKVIIHRHPKRADAPERSRVEADQCCKPPVSYGWDWCPRILPSGIWKPAYIETRKVDYIVSCEPFYTLDENRTTAKVQFQTICDGTVTYCVYAPNGELIYSGTNNEFTVENIQLWWCNGQGEPNLYTWTAESLSDKKCGTIGFRTVRLVHNEDADEVDGFPKGRYACPITIELNGRRIFAKGSNYVNPEIFFGRITEETYEQQVRLARDANMNIFRCWGGAGIHKPEFYSMCDRYGIMVWQEFMLACNNYIGTDSYLAVLERESTSVLRQLRHHPSIVLWCGGNELFNNWSNMDNQSLALRLLDKLCYENDRNTPFLMTSPECGMAHGGYTFYDESEKMDVFGLFSRAKNTAYTEFGVPCITNAEDLKKIIPEDELFPIRETPSWTLHHGFHAWINDSWVCNSILNQYFGEDDNLEKRIIHSNWLQCIGYKVIFEEARRQWGHCSMAINWCYNEPWITAAGNSILTYPSKPKPSYYAIQTSLKPSVISARIPKFDWNGGEIFSAELWFLNDLPEAVEDRITVKLTVGDTEYNLLNWDTGVVEANRNKIGPTVNVKLPLESDSDMITLTLISENGNSNKYDLFFRNGKVKSFSLTMNI